MPTTLAPAPRLAYDRDGSVAFISRPRTTDRVPTEILPAQLARLNADAMGGIEVPASWWNLDTAITENWVTLVLPVSTRLEAWFGSARVRSRTSGLAPTDYEGSLDIELQTSRNTTHGLDWDWETLQVKTAAEAHLPYSTEGANVLPDGTPGIDKEANTSLLRMYQEADLTGTGWKRVFGPARRHVRGVRMRFPRASPDALGAFIRVLLHLHLYGVPDDDATYDRLEFLDAETLEPLGIFSWGDIDFKDSATRDVVVRNVSETLTAMNITLSTRSGYPVGAPSSVGALALSATSIPDLMPGAVSDPITVTLDPTAGIIGHRLARLEAEVGTWFG